MLLPLTERYKRVCLIATYIFMSVVKRILVPPCKFHLACVMDITDILYTAAQRILVEIVLRPYIWATVIICWSLVQILLMAV